MAVNVAWATFSASSFSHLRQNLKETCKDSSLVELNMASKEKLRNRFLFLCQHLGSWGEYVVKSKCVAKISEFVVNSKCVSKNLECVVHNLKCVLNNSKCVVK